MTTIPIYRIQLVREGTAPVARPITTADMAAGVARVLIGHADREHLMLVLLDARHRVIGAQTLAIGTLTESLAHPREVFKAAILANAAAIILAHNHPSGDPTPSAADIELTRRLARAGDILGIPLLDHLIVTPDEYNSSSLRQLGHLPTRTASRRVER